MKKKTLIYSLFIFVSFLSLILLSCGDKHRDGKAIYINVGSEPRSIDPALNNAVDGSIYIFSMLLKVWLQEIKIIKS